MKRTMLYLSLLAVSCSVSAAKYPVLTESSPEKAGFNVERLNQMDRWISQQVDVGYPGVNLLIIKDNQIVYRKAWGAAKKYDGSVLMEQPLKATTGTLYDLASNTKMYATNFALQKLMSEGKLHPDDRIAKYIPGFADSPNDTIKGKNTLRISDLLYHSGGFPADPQYPNKAVAGALYSQDKGQTLEMIKRTPLEYQPGSKHIYSDV
ncbi:TPA: serine hydrolase, partial [Escherichia coli]